MLKSLQRRILRAVVDRRGFGRHNLMHCLVKLDSAIYLIDDVSYKHFAVAQHRTTDRTWYIFV